MKTYRSPYLERRRKVGWDLYSLLDKYEYLCFLKFVFWKLKILFLKYQIMAKTLPICIIAEKVEPGSSIPKNKDMIFVHDAILADL